MARPATKWEAFATQKGITKKKRSKLVFDEGAQDWKRRFGYGKADDDEAIPIIEARKNEAVGIQNVNFLINPLIATEHFYVCPACWGMLPIYATPL